MGSLDLPRGGVAVWHAHVEEVWPDGDRWEAALDWLSADERARLSRYRADSDRRMFLVGRVLARTLVGRALGVAPTAWTWSIGARGRPGVAGQAGGPSFNLAHSTGLVACAIAHEGPVGVDVEGRTRRAIDPRLVRRFCAPHEVADIEARPADGWRDQFLKYWTLKEAYLKARGLGIAVCLADVAFRFTPAGIELDLRNSLADADADWAFELREIGDRHYLAAAAAAPGGVRPTFVFAPAPAGLFPSPS